MLAPSLSPQQSSLLLCLFLQDLAALLEDPIRKVVQALATHLIMRISSHHLRATQICITSQFLLSV
jgi:hypothetical protein